MMHILKLLMNGSLSENISGVRSAMKSFADAEVRYTTVTAQRLASQLILGVLLLVCTFALLITLLVSTVIGVVVLVPTLNPAVPTEHILLYVLGGIGTLFVVFVFLMAVSAAKTRGLISKYLSHWSDQ